MRLSFSNPPHTVLMLCTLLRKEGLVRGEMQLTEAALRQVEPLLQPQPQTVLPHLLAMQVKEGGTVFFRESCFKQSGDKQRKSNPTHYRNPRKYFAIWEATEIEQPDGRFASYELVSCKCVDTYVRLKGNQNQICWKWRKVGPSLHGPAIAPEYLV